MAKTKKVAVDETRVGLVTAAKELNKVLGLEPSIDIKLENEALEKVLEEAASFITPDDVLTDGVRETLEDLGFLTPPKKAKTTKAKKAKPAPVVEEEDEDEDEDEEEDEEDIPLDDDDEEEEEEAPAKKVVKKAKAVKAAGTSPKWQTAIECIVANPKITADELMAEMAELPSGAYNAGTTAAYVREIGMTIELYKKSLKK